MRTLLVTLMLLPCVMVAAQSDWRTLPPFLKLSNSEKKQAIEATRRAVTLWLRKDYEGLYARVSRAGKLFEALQQVDEARRKERFIRFSSAWRERNPYNAQLRADEKIERLRTIEVTPVFLTSIAMMDMREKYFRSLLDGTWKPEEKLAFVEYHIRGKRYIETLLLEAGEWRIIGIPLQMNEEMIARYEARGKSMGR